MSWSQGNVQTPQKFLDMRPAHSAYFTTMIVLAHLISPKFFQEQTYWDRGPLPTSECYLNGFSCQVACTREAGDAGHKINFLTSRPRIYEWIPQWRGSGAGPVPLRIGNSITAIWVKLLGLFSWVLSGWIGRYFFLVKWKFDSAICLSCDWPCV